MSEKTQSKFSAIIQSRKEGASAAEAEDSKQPEPTVHLVPKPKAAATTDGAGEGTPHKRSRGRPKANGKRLNPDYTQVTAYIPAELHTETKINLIRTGKREFSVLIEELLTAWNKKQAPAQQTA